MKCKGELDSQPFDNMKLNSEVFFEVFPFHVVFDFKMQIRSVGLGINTVMGDLIGRDIDEVFQINRPAMEFNIKNVSRGGVVWDSGGVASRKGCTAQSGLGGRGMV